MSKPVSLKNKKYKQGLFVPRNRDKYIGDITKINYKSSWELKFMIWCDENPDVIKWNSEDIIIPYFSRVDNKERRYYIDFVFEGKKTNGETELYLVEIKPDSQTKVPIKQNRMTPRYLKECYDYQVNLDKWDAANKFAKQKNAKFIILTEYDLGIKKR
jgi:uncharacterized protein YprB with RNaseH-like and TPR domain